MGDGIETDNGLGPELMTDRGWNRTRVGAGIEGDQVVVDRRPGDERQNLNR